MPFDPPQPAGQYPSPAYERDALLWERWRAGGDQRALARLLSHAEPLVLAAARRAVRLNSGASFEDAAQSARLALVTAAQTWDPADGTCFAQYARRAVMLGAQHGAAASAPTADASLDDTVAADAGPGGGPLTLADVLPDPAATADHTDRLDDHAGRIAIREAMRALPERTRSVLQARLQSPPVRRAVLARHWGISLGRVSHIEQQGRSQVIAAAREMLAATRRK